MKSLGCKLSTWINLDSTKLPSKTPLRGWDGVPEVNNILNSSNWDQPLQIMKKTGPKYPSISFCLYHSLCPTHVSWNMQLLLFGTCLDWQRPTANRQALVGHVSISQRFQPELLTTSASSSPGFKVDQDSLESAANGKSTFNAPGMSNGCVGNWLFFANIQGTWCF